MVSRLVMFFTLDGIEDTIVAVDLINVTDLVVIGGVAGRDFGEFALVNFHDNHL